MRKLSAAALGLLMSAFAAGQVVAAPASCDNIYNTANGTATFPGTYVGQVGNNGSGLVCQIGKGYSNLDPVRIGGTSGNTIIFSFYYGGGNLTIEQWVGNNGLFNASTDWNAYLISLASQSSTVAGSLLGSLDVPFSSGPSFAGYIIQNMYLNPGYYAIKNIVGSDFEDPQFQLNFSSVAAAVPEPATLALFGAGLWGLGALRRRRAAKA